MASVSSYIINFIALPRESSIMLSNIVKFQLNIFHRRIRGYNVKIYLKFGSLTKGAIACMFFKDHHTASEFALASKGSR